MRAPQPDRETSPLAQGGIVFGPVLHPVPPLGDAVTASSIGLERHVEIRNQEGTAFLCHPDQGTNPPIRATQPIRAATACELEPDRILVHASGSDLGSALPVEIVVMPV